MVIDYELLEQCQRGKPRACNQLYELLFSYLMNICIRYNSNNDEASAALNAIFLKIITNLKQYDRQKHFLPWVKAIAMNHLANEYKVKKELQNNLLFTDELKKFEDEVQDFNILAKLQAKDLVRMIQKLPTSCNRIFNLYVIDGYNHQEIADMLGINEGTSKSQLYYARIKLQKMIEEEQNSIKLIRCDKAG